MTTIPVRKWSVFALVLGALLMPLKSPADDRQSPVKAVEEAVVVDARGDRLGNILNLNGPVALVLIQVSGRLISLNVVKQQLLATGGPLFFTTPNCTGTPFVTAQPPALVTPSVLASPGNSLWVGNANAVPQLIIALSTLPPTPPGVPPICLPTVPPTPPGGPTPPPPPQVFAVPASRLIDLNTVFTAPFSVRTEQ